jgi:hypothetical protein
MMLAGKQNPPSFGWYLGAALLLFFVLSLLVEKTTLGRLLLGHRQELFPMSTFTVFVHPRLSGATAYAFRVTPAATTARATTEHAAGLKSGLIRFDAMFAPLRSSDLEDGITFQFLDRLVRSVQAGCPAYQIYGQSACMADPVTPFELPDGLAALWETSLAQLLPAASNPSLSPIRSLILVKLRWSFNPDSPERISGPVETPLIQFQLPDHKGGAWRTRLI